MNMTFFAPGSKKKIFLGLGDPWKNFSGDFFQKNFLEVVDFSWARIV